MFKIKIDDVCNFQSNLGFAKPRPGQSKLGVPPDDPRLQGAAGVQPPRRRRPHEQPPDHRLHQVHQTFLQSSWQNLQFSSKMAL